MAKKANPVLLPKPGDTLEIYLSHPEHGNGIKSWIVLRVGRKFVTLLQPATLRSIQFSWAAWNSLIVVRRYKADIPWLINSITQKQNLWRSIKKPYKSAEVVAVLDLLRQRLPRTGRRPAHSDQHRSA